MNKVLIDIVRDTPRNRKLLIENLTASFNKAYKNIPSTRKRVKHYMNIHKATEYCNKAYGWNNTSSVSSRRQKTISINRCIDNKTGTYTYSYTGTTYTGQLFTSKQKDIIFIYLIGIDKNESLRYQVEIKVDDKKLLIYRHGNKRSPYSWLTNLIHDVMKKNNIKSLGLKYYKY